MGSTPISTGFLLISLALVVLLEGILAQTGAWLQLPRLWVLCVTRLAQLSAILALTTFIMGDWRAIGLDRNTWRKGLKKGLIWSAGFAVIAGLLFIGLFAFGQNPLRLIRTTLPSTATLQWLFFFVGGILAPITEEIIFRGLIFGYLLRWGPLVAVLITTALFAALHLPTLPITQIVGGMVFAVAYYIEGSLMAPIIIHMLGNLAIFTLSLPFLRAFW